MKAYPSYKEYKPSNVDWLGEIPEHWEVKKLKDIVSIPITDGPHETPELVSEGVPFISAEAISSGKIDFEKRRGDISGEDDLRFSLKYSPKKFDIYIVKSGATTGVSAIVETETHFNIWSPLAVVRCASSHHPYFILNYIRSKQFQTAITLYWSFGTQQNIGMNILSDLHIVSPPFSEQKKIADFLDRETAKIDSLIKKRNDLIKLLQEKRSAVISHAVTKGIDPTVRLKPSNVDWLGEIPEHWEVKKLKYTASIKTGFAFNSEDYDDEGVPLIRISDIAQDGTISLNNTKYLPQTFAKKYSEFYVNKNDILMAMTGATIGKAGRYTQDNTALLNQRVCKFMPKKLNNDFLWFLLKSNQYCEYIKITSLGGAQANISDNLLLDFLATIPPFSEQQEIVDFLDRETAKIDSLIEKEKQIIEKMKEYRTALISAAVTGKIDVRGEVAHE